MLHNEMYNLLSAQITEAKTDYENANLKRNQDPSVAALQDLSYTYGRYVALVRLRGEFDALIRRPISR